MSNYDSPSSVNKLAMGCGITAVLAVVILIAGSMIVHATGGLGYFNHQIKADEVGILFERGKPTEVFGPSVQTCWPCPGRFLDIRNVNIHGLQFTADDPEIITQDNYRIGATVTGTVLKPGVGQADKLLKDWANYNQFYTNDAALVGTQTKDAKGNVTTTPGLMQNFAQQALKVCIGQANFLDAVIGSGRDKVRQCVDSEMTSLASNYDLTIQNVVVPNFVIQKSLQDQLDAKAAATTAIQVANEKAQQATAEGKQKVAENQATIDVQQSTAQEQARQQEVLAGLATKAAEAKTAQINAEKANDLLSAQRDLQINQAKAAAASEQAKADNAGLAYQASVYQANPAYTQYASTKANADAFGKQDKTMIVQPGTNVNTILGNGQTPVIANASK